MDAKRARAVRSAAAARASPSSSGMKPLVARAAANRPSALDRGAIGRWPAAACWDPAGVDSGLGEERPEMRPLLDHEPDVHRQALQVLVYGALLAAKRMCGAERGDLVREPGSAVRVDLAEPRDLEHPGD